jgi:hypothetical protein
MDKKILIGQVDAKQIEAWKTECKDGIYCIEVDGHVGYFRECTRHDVNLAMQVDREENAKPLDGVAKFAELCFIGGSELLKTKDKYFLSIAPDLRGKMNPLETKLVNL